MLEFEKAAAAGATIQSYADALWWAAATVTTVGYGDRYPITAGGRGVAVLLMIVGIAVFGVLTATVAAFFVEQEEEGGLKEVADRLESIERRLGELEKRP